MVDGSSVLAEEGSPRSSTQARSSLGPERVIEIQRARILGAMVEECATRGVSNVTVAHVVQRAGVSRRTFYEIFDDRDECFLAAFEDAIDRASRWVLDAYDPGANWVQRVRTFVAAVLSFLDAEPGAGRLLIVGSLGGGADVLERRRGVIARLVAVCDEGSGELKGSRELLPLIGEGVVGGVLSVLHSRLSEERSGPFVELTGPLVGMIVLPYLGSTAARRETLRPVPRSLLDAPAARTDPLRDLGMRLTYRTVRVLLAVAARPGSSNRQIADGSGISDQGQISKLLARLHGLGLVENGVGGGSLRGAPNAWVLTAKGRDLEDALARESGARQA